MQNKSVVPYYKMFSCCSNWLWTVFLKLLLWTSYINQGIKNALYQKTFLMIPKPSWCSWRTASEPPGWCGSGSSRFPELTTALVPHEAVTLSSATWVVATWYNPASFDLPVMLPSAKLWCLECNLMEFGQLSAKCVFCILILICFLSFCSSNVQ